jgi:hypothetical protein
MVPVFNEIAERRRIFRGVVAYFGTIQPADFFRHTSVRVPNVERVHPLIEGIATANKAKH